MGFYLGFTGSSSFLSTFDCFTEFSFFLLQGYGDSSMGYDPGMHQVNSP